MQQEGSSGRQHGEHKGAAELILPIPTYNFQTAVTRLLRQTQGNHESRNTVALVVNGKEGPFSMVQKPGMSSDTLAMGPPTLI